MAAFGAKNVESALEDSWRSSDVVLSIKLLLGSQEKIKIIIHRKKEFVKSIMF